MKTAVKLSALILILMASVTNELWAQSVINGKVIDELNNQGLPWTNVVLLTNIDSTYVTGTTSNEDGSFALQIPDGNNNYLIRVSYIGYETWIGDISSPNLDNIKLLQSSEILSEVEVTGSKKIFKLENGGISADIQNSILKDMGALPDILGQLPFVIRDEDNYTVFGKGTPTFYINNRLVRNQFELQQISSKDIKKVTVITNPGAEYDASVSAIIKIETIGLVGEGLSGQIFTFNKYNKEWYSINRISLNYRKKNFDIFGNIQYYNMNFPKDRKVNHQIHTNQGITTIFSDSKENDSWKFWTPQLGLNYLINKDHSLGAKYEYTHTYDRSGHYKVNTDVLKNENLEESLYSDKEYKTKEYTHYVNAYYNGKISEWLTTKLDLDYKTTDRNNNSNVVNTEKNKDKQDVITSEETIYNLYAGKLTLNTLAWEGNFSYGVEASYTSTEQNAYVIEDSGIPGIIPSDNKIKQSLMAGFISYNKSFGSFSGDLGIRHENVHSKYYQYDKLVEEQSKSYRHLFPSARLSYNDDNIQMELAYKNSISRPSYQNLQSSIYYNAPYVYYSGDPFLQPTYKNSLTYMVMWNNLTCMIVYNDYKDRIIHLHQKYLDNSIISKPVNLNKSEQLELSINYTRAFGIWKPNWSISMTKDYMGFGTSPIKYNKPIFYASLKNAFQFEKWQVGADINMRTKGNQDAEYLENNSWSTNMYINKSFLKDVLMINITGTNIFNTYDDQVHYLSNGISVNYDNYMYRRSVMVGITYRFNATRDRYKGSRSTDELNRL